MQASNNSIETFFSQYKTISYKKHEVLLRPDEIPSGVFYISKGYARLYAISETGEELTLIIFMPGNMFPLTYALNGTLHTYYVEALTPLEVRKAPVQEFLSFMHSNPEMFAIVIQGVLTRVTGLLERMEYLVFGNSYQKTASMLLLCAKRFGTKQEDGLFLDIPLTHKDIGMLIGVTRETVSAEIKKLERKQLITHRNGHIIVTNPQGLKNESLLYLE